MFEVAVSVCKTFVITMIKNLRRCGKKRYAEIHFDTFFFTELVEKILRGY